MMSRPELEDEVIRLRHLRSEDKRISEDAEEKVRTLQNEEFSCGKRLKELSSKMREALLRGSVDTVVKMLEECESIAGLLLHIGPVK